MVLAIRVPPSRACESPRGKQRPTHSHPMNYSKNPIIDRFLQLTIEEGKSVRGVSLCQRPNSCKVVVFSLDDGSDSHLVDTTDGSNFVSMWRDSSAMIRRFKSVDLSPAC